MSNQSTYKVFISYSRKNKEVAHRLSDYLRRNDYDVWLDVNKIPFTVDWWEEIQRGIISSDAVIFIASTDSVKSPVCQLELDYARQFSKRLVPLVIEDIAFETARMALAGTQLSEHLLTILNQREIVTIARQNETFISRYNWIVAKSPETFTVAFDKLEEALKIDFTYVRTHTRLNELAHRWNNNPENATLLLTSHDLQRYSQWYAKAEKQTQEPYPNQLQKDFLEASKKKARIRQSRQITVSVLSAIVVLTIGIFFALNFLVKPEIPRLDGTLNIALLVPENASQEQLWLFDQLQAAIQQAQAEQAAIQQTETQQTQLDIDYYPTTDSTTRHWDDLESIVHDTGADLGIQIFLNDDSEVVIELYVLQSVSRSIEFTGNTQFGAPIPVRLPLDSGSKTQLLSPLSQRLSALIAFITGLGNVNNEDFEHALIDFKQFYDLADDSELKALSLIWSGNVLLEWDEDEPPQCPLEVPVSDNIYQASSTSTSQIFNCASLVYATALEYNPDLWRAHIGLGNVYLDQARQVQFGMPYVQCNAYQESVNHYLDAIQETDNPVLDARTQQKALLNIGAAYSALFQDILLGYCPSNSASTTQNLAQDYLQRAVSRVDEFPELTDSIDSATLIVDALRMQAIIYRYSSDYDLSEASLDQAKSLLDTMDLGTYETALRVDIRLDELMLALGRSDISGDYQTSLELSNEIIAELESTSRVDDDRIAKAYYARGLAQVALGDTQSGVDDFEHVVDLVDSNSGLFLQAYEQIEEYSE